MRDMIQRNGTGWLKRGMIALGTFAIVFLLAAGPAVQAADSGCDPQYMQALNGRAQIEAMRQTAKNKNLIYKADSVLEYNCFFSFVEHAKSRTSMPVAAGAWDAVVTTPGFRYLAPNFGHYYLGGRFNPGGAALPPDTYVCDAMARMWEYGRCINMNQYGGMDGFFDFSWYVNQDPRQFPVGYAACQPAMSVNPNNMAAAFNGRQADWLMPPDLGQDGTSYPIDPVVTYQNLISWDPAVGGTAECGDPIPTGLTIYRRNTTYPDFICAKPGCTYVPGGGPAGGTCEQ